MFDPPDREGTVAPPPSIESPPDSLIAVVAAAMTPDPHRESRPTVDVLAEVLDHVRDGVCLTTAELEGEGPRIVHVNPAFTAMTGYERDAVIGRSPRLLQGPATDPSARARLKQDLLAGRMTKAELVNYRRDGTAFIMRVCVFPVRDRAGTITHFLALERDVTHERVTEQSGRIFAAVLQQTTDAVALLDQHARITYVNPAAVQLTGMPAAELLSRGVRATGLTPRRLRVYRDIVAALETQHEWRGEYDTSARRGESRRLSVSVTRIESDDAGSRFVVSARDVTHQRRLEYIAEATNLVENVGYVFAGLRHELGNPINSIKTALTLLRQTSRTLPPERLEDYLDRVLVEMGRVEYLLRSLHSFNTVNRPTLEPVAVKPFTARFAEIIRKDVERRGVTLLVDVDDDVGSAIADPRALHQVVLNLVTNALDALDGRDGGRIQLAARRGVSHVRLLVSDDGPGIAPDQRGSIFKPFHTTKARGTGLGLAITRKLVTWMRGTIELETGLGWTTTFTITLDAADPAGPERKSISFWPPPPPRGAA